MGVDEAGREDTTYEPPRLQVLGSLSELTASSEPYDVTPFYTGPELGPNRESE
jgi:hypothetical protein